VEQHVESVLEERAHQNANDRSARKSLIVSIGIHLILFCGVILAPLLAAREVEPLEFVAVQIVPIQALGVEKPTPAVKKSAPTPEVKKEPKVEEPEPDAEGETPSEPDPEPAVSTKPVSSKPETEAPPVETRNTQPTDPAKREGSPLGSSLGSSKFGAAVGGLDNPDFVYGYYVDQMLAMISANWQRPSLGGKVEAMVHFRIRKDGSISELRVVQSSGYNSFDLAGLRAVQLATPFPKFPQSYRHNSLGVNLILR